MTHANDIDAAKALLITHIANRSILGVDDVEQSEADTRSKLIDPIFQAVLGWPETDITREDPVTDGYADYTFGGDFKWFHVEAKRTLPRFKLHVPSRARKLKLSGAHLMGNKDVAPLIEQTAKYSFDLGTEFAVLTNGSQFILFQAQSRGGRKWRDGYALVWHDHQDVLDRFPEFYSLLAKPNVDAGILASEFAKTLSISTPTFAPLQFVHNPEAELVRNPFWSNIAQAFTPLLVDQPENSELQLEIIKNCYVTSGVANESHADITRLLEDLMPKFVRDAGGQELRLDDKGRGLRAQVVDHIKQSKPGTWVLTGGVGSGKTTFLRRYAMIDRHPYIEQYCVWLHVDFLEFGSDLVEDLGSRIAEYTLNEILAILKTSYAHYVPETGEALRELFAEEIAELGKTLLFGVDPISLHYIDTVNHRVEELATDPKSFVSAILRRIRANSRAVVFVLDNTDQHGEAFQRAVFLFSQALSDSYQTLAIVSLREEKFFAAYRQGVFDAYGSRKFHIGSPPLIAVIKRRLEYGLRRYAEHAKQNQIPEARQQKVANVVRTLLNASTQINGNIIRFLSCVSAGDMRLALKMFSDFLSSGNTDVAKIETIVERNERQGRMVPYKMPFHEFAKAAILGSRKYYKASVARIINLFALSSAPNASHWTSARILSRLASAQRAPSPHGEGFITTKAILREFRESFGSAEDLVQTANTLLSSGLLESEPPRSHDLNVTEAVRISAAGAYYWRFLIRSFAYVDLVYIDTALRSESLARQLAKSSEVTKEELGLSHYTDVRIDRVRKFLDYLADVEQPEIQQSLQRGGPYGRALAPRIRQQIEREINIIHHRTR